jgi:hypothetical protein
MTLAQGTVEDLGWGRNGEGRSLPQDFGLTSWLRVEDLPLVWGKVGPHRIGPSGPSSAPPRRSPFHTKAPP